MKFTALLLGLFITTMTFAQQSTKATVVNAPNSPANKQTESIPEAQLNRTSEGSNYKYNFVSNRNMSAERAARWEDRFVSFYPDLVSVSIDSSTQEIELVLPSSHTATELEEMVMRFGYSGYHLVN